MPEDVITKAVEAMFASWEGGPKHPDYRPLVRVEGVYVPWDDLPKQPPSEDDAFAT